MVMIVTDYYSKHKSMYYIKILTKHTRNIEEFSSSKEATLITTKNKILCNFKLFLLLVLLFQLGSSESHLSIIYNILMFTFT